MFLHGIAAVQAFTLPDLSSPRLLAGGVLPLRALALSPSGATLAVAGDDPGIRLLAVGSSAVLRTLASAPYTRGLAYDPEGAYLASMGADGNLTVWDIESGRPVFSKKGLASKVCVLSPDGGGPRAGRRPAWKYCWSGVRWLRGPTP